MNLDLALEWNTLCEGLTPEQSEAARAEMLGTVFALVEAPLVMTRRVNETRAAMKRIVRNIRAQESIRGQES